MKQHILNGLLITQLVSGLPLLAGDALAAQDWQERGLLSPSGQQLLSEGRGRVVIYDGLDERLVDTALDTQFPRMQHMMFVGVRHIEPDGQESVDDDCD